MDVTLSDCPGIKSNDCSPQGHVHNTFR